LVELVETTDASGFDKLDRRNSERQPPEAN